MRHRTYVILVLLVISLFFAFFTPADAREECLVIAPNQRFARVFQVDPNHPGTAAQRQALYDRLHPTFGTKQDYLNWRLARAIKRVRPCIVLGFHPDMTYPSLSSPSGINFSDRLNVSGTKQYAGHEYGWIVNHYLLSDADKLWFMDKVGADNFGIPVQEQFAMAVNEWLDGGWLALDEILLLDEEPGTPPGIIPYGG